MTLMYLRLHFFEKTIIKPVTLPCSLPANQSVIFTFDPPLSSPFSHNIVQAQFQIVGTEYSGTMFTAAKAKGKLLSVPIVIDHTITAYEQGRFCRNTQGEEFLVYFQTLRSPKRRPFQLRLSRIDFRLSPKDAWTPIYRRGPRKRDLRTEYKIFRPAPLTGRSKR